MTTDCMNSTFRVLAENTPDRISYKGCSWELVSVPVVRSNGEEEVVHIASISLEGELERNDDLDGHVDNMISYYATDDEMLYDILETVLNEKIAEQKYFMVTVKEVIEKRILTKASSVSDARDLALVRVNEGEINMEAEEDGRGGCDPIIDTYVTACEEVDRKYVVGMNAQVSYDPILNEDTEEVK